mgnify:CR=1 FL=1
MELFPANDGTGLVNGDYDPAVIPDQINPYVYRVWERIRKATSRKRAMEAVSEIFVGVAGVGQEPE